MRRHFGAAAALACALAAAAPTALADGWGGGDQLRPGNLLVSGSTYREADIQPGVTQLPPGCSAANCVTASTDGAYPYVFNNDVVDSSFGVTSPIFLWQLTPNGEVVGKIKVPTHAGTTEQFRKDAQLHRIAEKLQTEFVAQVGHKAAPSEVHAWQNSLSALSMLLDQAQLNDHGVILEYQLGNTSRRLDAMLTGRADTSTENAVVVELKQWTGETIGPSTADNCVELRLGTQVRRVLHPSVQVGGYQQWLLDNHVVFYETDAVALTAVSYLHNYQFDPTGELWRIAMPRRSTATRSTPATSRTSSPSSSSSS